MKISRKKLFLAGAALCVVLAGGYLVILPKLTEGLEMDTVALEDVPPAPTLPVEEALPTMVLQDGFVLEPVASEPDVFSPIVMTFDGDGRMWVCEFVTYMPTVDAENEEVPQSNIVILSDEDGDGKVDKRTMFLDDVVLPRAIAMVEGGILYADHTQLYFAEVLEDDSLGLHEVVDPTYAAGGNVEHKPNGLLYGMDGWYYSADSERKYKTLPLDAPVPPGAKEIYRNKYWKLALDRAQYRGQWGISMDDEGRLFYNANASPARGEVLRADALLHNPDYMFEVKAVPMGDTLVYPVRMNPGVNRGYAGRDTLVKWGKDKGKLRKFTASSGNAIYRGDNFPAEYYGMSLTPEPAGNLVSARRVIDGETSLSGTEIFPEQELLASTDERFRPVNLNQAPDGTIYVVDMYHGVIQHKTFLTDYLKRQIKARALDTGNNTMGRIYRLRWADNAPGPQPEMEDAAPAELVHNLAHPNGWWRDTARRLLVQSRDTSIAPAVAALISSSDDPRGQIEALWTLYGLSAVTPDAVEAGLAADDPRVQRTAIAVSAALPLEDRAALAETLESRATGSYRMAVEVALAAGGLPDGAGFDALLAVLDAHGDAPYIKEAVISGLTGQEKAFEKRLDSRRHKDLIEMLDNKAGALQLSGRDNLSDADKAAFDLGKELYEGDAGCGGCHGPRGQGLDDMGPPFIASEWVLGSPERLAKIMLHGLEGEITVNGVDYAPAMTMPGLAQSDEFEDSHLSAVVTYLRNAWGNIGTPVPAEVFARVRAETEGRDLPYEVRDLRE